jgi:signal transduction histidine kinase
MVEDRAGFLWFGTWGGGLNRFDRRTGRFKAYRHDPADAASLSDDYVLSLLIDHRGILWAGTNDGLNRLDARSGRFTHFRWKSGSLESRWYRVLAEGADGSIWMGTYTQGLQRLDVRTGEIVAYKYDPKVSGSLSNNRVNALCVDHAGTLWVGTQNGLDRFDRNTGEFTTFGERDGSPNNAVEGIVEDSAGNLWLSTGNGLSRFDPRARTFKNYYSEDGLAGDEFSESCAYKSASGEMIFGGVKGVTAFYPEKVVDSPFEPPVVLTDFLLFNNPVPVGGRSPLKRSTTYTESLTLSHAQNIFSLEFSALSFARPTRTRYRYRLEGLETPWNETTAAHRLVTYTTLPPRSYHFRVQSKDNRGGWSEPGLALAIRVLPAWWNMWQFRAVWITALLLLTGFAFRHRVRQLEHEFTVRVEERVSERTRIARDLHDTLLQSIQASLLQMHTAHKLVSRRPEQAEENLARAVDITENAIAESRDAIQALRSQTSLESNLLKLLTLAGKELAGSRDGQANTATFRVTVEGERAYSLKALAGKQNLNPLIQDEAYRIARELLRNAFQHADASEIEVAIRYEDRQFRLRVRDDGKGIDPKILTAGGRTGHWGLTGMGERAKQIGGQLNIWSQMGAGTEVELSIPGAIAYKGARDGHRPFALFHRKRAQS